MQLVKHINLQDLQNIPLMLHQPPHGLLAIYSLRLIIIVSLTYFLFLKNIIVTLQY